MKKEAFALETVVRYSTLNLLGYLLICLLLEVVIIHHLWTVKPWGIGAPFMFLMGIGCVFVVCRQLWLLFHNRPQVTISDEGIRLASGALDTWENIQDEEVRKVRRGRGTDILLYYTVAGAVRQLNIRELAISYSQLAALLEQHRKRFDKRHNP
ncbi:hypothetical protein [Hymenobacter norwichensis]|uniref:hypothetical protein n=1 Tax=Hymenobacter norwichensis TaxID=223903 RepID=UPI0003B4D3F2|nr:hypothetical protein [Hymenobacter norwichensis]